MVTIIQSRLLPDWEWRWSWWRLRWEVHSWEPYTFREAGVLEGCEDWSPLW